MTTRRPLLRIGLGVLLLALAVGTVALARGTADAANAFRQGQSEWQRGLAPTTSVHPGPLQRTGETLLGIGLRAKVLRAYQDYRAGLADVIPGTTYPQTRARFELVKRLEELRPSFGSRADRASVDVLLGAVLTADAATAGQQREAQIAKALAAFGQAAAENPANDTAKLDLEVLLRATAPRPKSNARATGSPSKKRQGNNTPRNPPTPTRVPGTGF
jgi:hypothetical protein